MIQKISARISKRYIANGSSQTDAEVIAYGAECLMTFLISILSLVLVGILTNHLLYLLVWSASFLLLRMNLGGVHAPSHGVCIVLGTLIGACSIPFSSLWLGNAIPSAAAVFLCLLVAVSIAPVRHKNKPIPATETGRIKVKVALIAFLECVVALLCLSVAPMVSAYMVSGMVMATLLAVAGIFLNPHL